MALISALAAAVPARAEELWPDFQVSNLPPVPRAQAPKALDSAASGLDSGSVDVDALEKYEAATEFDKGESSPEEKAESWRTFARAAPKFAALAGKRAAEWDRFAAEWKAGEEARARRLEARDSDWAKLSRLLALKGVPETDKQRWSAQFVGAYLESPGIETSAAAELVKHTPASSVPEALARLAKSAPAGAPRAPVPARGRAAKGKAGIQWVSIPGGSFMMGSDGGSADEKPVHRVTVKAFQLAKTEVTNKQYRVCVESGACTAPISYEGGDDHPVVNVYWEQARKFCEWVGGRLPTEAEWEYAARSAGKDSNYPWGNEGATCERAVLSACGRGTAPVCSKASGNTAQGLCDMAGNVWEFTQDWYHDSYKGAPTDGSAWESPAGYHRVFRGGSWVFDAGFARVAYRNTYIFDRDLRNFHLGFRPAR